MSGPLCIFVVIFGEAYQDYLPLYIRSIHRAYPDYHVLAYTDRPLTAGVRAQLEILRPLGPFRVREGAFAEYPQLRGQGAKSLRWLTWDDTFADYAAVYIGDVDFFICREDPPLHVQHERHCDVLGLPYSNLLRNPDAQHRGSPILYLRTLVKSGPLALLDYAGHPRRPVRALSGLHYARTGDYFDRVRPLFPRFLALARREMARPLYLPHHCGFRNECLLYDLVEAAGLGNIPPYRGSNDLLAPNDWRHSTQPFFRPGHGLHLGIFRTEETLQANAPLLQSAPYRHYARALQAALRDDPVLAALRRHFSPALARLLEKALTVLAPNEAEDAAIACEAP